jgi:hypothetical protein
MDFFALGAFPFFAPRAKNAPRRKPGYQPFGLQ